MYHCHEVLKILVIFAKKRKKKFWPAENLNWAHCPLGKQCWAVGTAGHCGQCCLGEEARPPHIITQHVDVRKLLWVWHGDAAASASPSAP